MGTASVWNQLLSPTVLRLMSQPTDYTYTPPTSYNPYTPTSSYGYSPQSNYVYGEYQPMNYSYSGIMGANDPYTSSYSSTGVESNFYGASQPYTNPYAGMTYSPISGKYNSYSIAPSQFQPYTPPTTMTPSATPAPVQPYTPPAPIAPPPAPVVPPPAPVVDTRAEDIQKIRNEMSILQNRIFDAEANDSSDPAAEARYTELERQLLSM